MYRKIIIVTLSIILLASCSSSKSKKTQQLAQDTSAALLIQLATSNTINPNNWGEPSPVAVLILQLRDDTLFNIGDFSELYNRTDEILGDELISKQQLILQPNERYRITQILSPETKYIGLVVAYRNIEQADWRLSVATIKASKSILRAQLTGTQLSASIEPLTE